MSTWGEHRITRAKFPFKREYFDTAQSRRIQGLVIQTGHGYDYRAYMCTSCGDIIVVDQEMLFRERTDIERLVKDLCCMSCGYGLAHHLVLHPEYVFSDGAARRIQGTVDRSRFPATELVEVWTIDKLEP